MKRNICKTVCLCAVGLIGFIPFSPQAANIVLEKPDMSGGISLGEAINRRESRREFSPEKIKPQILSNIFYAAFGISHDGKHTIPTARNQKNLVVFAIMPNGVYRYNPDEHQLEEISSKNLIPLLSTQDFVEDSPLNLVFVGSDPKYSPLHAGSAYQNVALYAGSVGLNNVVRGAFDKKKMAQELGLKEDEFVIISQTIGYPYK